MIWHNSQSPRPESASTTAGRTHLIRYLEWIRVSNDPSKGWEMMHAIELFGQMGTNAQPAMRMLVTMLNHPDPNVREALTNSLPRIDADAATRAGVKRL